MFLQKVNGLISIIQRRLTILRYVGMLRNGRPVSIGMGGRNQSEWVAGMGRNTHNTVVAHGTIPKEVMEEASSKGCPEAVIVFVPENDMVHVY